MSQDPHEEHPKPKPKASPFKKNPFFGFIEDVSESFIFWSRWIQAPMYMGLVFGSAMYVYKFFIELFHLYSNIQEMTEVKLMLGILSLVDITMVINLVIMVIIGGYSIFTSNIDVSHHEDKPLWLENMDAGILKIKLATSLASISGVHLLKTFINIREEAVLETYEGIYVEIVIHLVFILSALLLALVEKALENHRPH